MARPNLFVTDSLPSKARELLSGFEIREKEADDEFLATCSVLMCWPSKAKAELLQRMPALQVVQTMSAGVDGIDFSAVPPGSQVFSNAGAFTESVAEHAWGMLLGVAKGLHLRKVRSTPRKLREKMLLVVGCGAIGTEVGELSKSLAMKRIGVSRSFNDPGLFEERYPAGSLADVIGRADAVVLTLPFTKRTAGMMTYDVLSRAKPEVIVVNVGRGGTVDEAGLIRWLTERPESRYATDVYWKEKGKETFDTPAWDLPNFAGTLHISGVPLGEDLEGAKVAAAWNIKRYFETGQALHHVDRDEYM